MPLTFKTHRIGISIAAALILTVLWAGTGHSHSGRYTVEGMTTDAMQAMVRMDGANVQAMYLGGGTSLKTSAGTIQRSVPGLAYVGKATDGSYIVGNPSPTEATVTITLPALTNLKAYVLDDTGKQTGAATVKSSGPQTFSLDFKANSKVGFAAN